MGPVERRVQRDITGADKEDQRRDEHEGHRKKGAIVQDLVPDRTVQQKNPTGGRDRSDMHSSEPLAEID